MFRRSFRSIGNRKTTSRLDDLAGTFSLHNTQLYVGSAKVEDGTMSKALSLLTNVFDGESGMGDVVIYLFSNGDAIRLVQFLDAILNRDLPAEFRFPPSATKLLVGDAQIKWTVKKFIPKWHDGGGFKGRLNFRGGHTITKLSAERLRACVVDFFGLDERDAGVTDAT